MCLVPAWRVGLGQRNSVFREDRECLTGGELRLGPPSLQPAQRFQNAPVSNNAQARAVFPSSGQDIVSTTRAEVTTGGFLVGDRASLLRRPMDRDRLRQHYGWLLRRPAARLRAIVLYRPPAFDMI